MGANRLARAGVEVFGACWVGAAVLSGILPIAPIFGIGGLVIGLWLALDAIAVAWLVHSIPPANQFFANQLTRLRTPSGPLPLRAETRGPNALGIARVLVVVAAIGLIQAILRRPIALLVATIVVDPAGEDALVAVGVLVALVLGLTRLHVLVHPVVVGTVRGALDAMLATSESPSVPQASRIAPPAPPAAGATVTRIAGDTQEATRTRLT